MGRALRSDRRHGGCEGDHERCRPWRVRLGCRRTAAVGDGTWRPPGEWHNGTPEEAYRTALLSDSPDAGCSLSPPRWEGWGSDPDAKLACGTPRAGRRVAGSLPPPTEGVRLRTRTRACGAGPRHRRSSIEHPLSGPRRCGEENNKPNKNSNQSRPESRGRGFRTI
jgi:hypothetical protein